MGGVRVTTTSCIPFKPLLTFSKSSCCIDPEVGHCISIEGRPKPFDDQQQKRYSCERSAETGGVVGKPFRVVVG